jgi:hypothetical protein
MLDMLKDERWEQMDDAGYRHPTSLHPNRGSTLDSFMAENGIEVVDIPHVPTWTAPMVLIESILPKGKQ